MHSVNGTPAEFIYFCCTPSREEYAPSVEHLRHLPTSGSGAMHSVNVAPAEFTHFRCTPSVKDCTPPMQHLRYLHAFVALRQGKNALCQCNTSGIYTLSLHSVSGRVRSVNGTPTAFTYFCCTPSREECTPSVEHLRNLPTFVRLRQWSNALRQWSTCGIYTFSLHSVSGRMHSVNATPPVFTYFCCAPSGEECTPSMQHLRYLRAFVALRQGKNALRQRNTSGIYILLLHSVKRRMHSVSGTPAEFAHS